MLIQYIVSNFKSIGHPIEFSMLPTEKDSKDDRLLKTIKTKHGDMKILRRGAFFGPNASGKSSFIKSIGFAKDFIVEGQRSGSAIRIDQFRERMRDLKGISTFQFVFYKNEEIYEYGFSLDPHYVHEEWLYLMTEKGFEPLFSRTTDDDGLTIIDTEKSLFVSDDEIKLGELLKTSIGPNQKNQLFLFKLYDNGIVVADDVINWFKFLQIIYPNSIVHALPFKIYQDNELCDYLGKMLNRLDTGVVKIEVPSKKADLQDMQREFHMPNSINDYIENTRNGIMNLRGKYFLYKEGENNQIIFYQLQFSHILNGNKVMFDINDESDGTQRLLDLLPILFSAKGIDDSIYFIDELDRSLHTKLSHFLLNEFVSCSDSTNSQLVFTAHDVNLIDTDLFRQEEIWFIEKNSKGESCLRPLSDFDLKDGQDVFKAYLCGRFGAVPAIRGGNKCLL